MVQAKAVKRSIFKLGRSIFCIKNCSDGYEKNLDLLLPRCDESSVSEDQIDEISTGCSKDVRQLFDHVLKRHYKCVWIRAACLVSPGGHKVLIAGEPGTGKSTLALALALEHGWKVAAEDVVLIDLESRKVVDFASPFAVRPGTSERLKEAIQKTPEPVVDEWFPLGEFALNEEIDAHFDAAWLLLSGWKPRLKVEPLNASEYLRKLLGLSNLLKRKGADTVGDLLSAASCMQMTGGTVRERMEAVVNRLVRDNCNE